LYNRELVARRVAPWYNARAGTTKGTTPGAPKHTERTNMQNEDTLAEYGPAVHPEVAADNAKRNSVVASKYKHRYAQRAVAGGNKRKAAQRSNWDWLAQTIAAQCLDERDHLVVDRFLALLDANGVVHSRWTNRSKGWEGRLRMTGRLALQRVVAEAGAIQLPDGDECEAPAEWVAKHTN